VIASVGGHEVELDTFCQYVEEVAAEPWQSVEERVASQLLDQLLDQEIVIAAVDAERQLVLPTVPGARASAFHALVDEVCGMPDAMPLGDLDSEIARLMQVERPARARVRQMILADAVEADTVRQRLAAGETFEALSSELSRAPNATGGGNLGVLETGTLPENFDRVIFGLAEGEISEAVESPAGFHVFQVLEVVPAGPPDRAEVRAGVVRKAEGRYAREFVRTCLDRLAADVGVRVYGDRLWFDYDGRYSEDRDGTM